MLRIDDLDHALSQVADLAAARSVNVVVCCGDIADPDCGSILVRVYDVLIRMAAKLEMNNIPFFIVAGNHDTIEDGSGRTTLHPLRNVPGVRIFEQPDATAFYNLGVRYADVLFLPFPSRTSVYDPEDEVRKAFVGKKDRKRVVIGHCTGIDDVQVGSETKDFARGSILPFPIEECIKHEVDFMGNGHFHKQQVTPAGIHIPGSLANLRFDEENHTPGILIASI